MVKESISAGKQGLRLLISGSDSLSLAGRATLPAAREYVLDSVFLPFPSPHIHSHISVKSLTHLCLFGFYSNALPGFL